MEFLLATTTILVLSLTLLGPSLSYSTGSVSTGFTFRSSSDQNNLTIFLTSVSARFAAGFLRTPAGLLLAISGVDSKLLPLDTVWAANPGRPFPAGCTVVFDGRLRVLDDRQESLWESSGYGGDALELADTGNLILRNATSGISWQSFDHPTDVLMQGQNLTQAMELVSESGGFRMRLEGDRLLLLDDTEPYFAIAALKEHDTSVNVSDAGVYLRIQDGYLGMYQNEQVRIHFLPFASMTSKATGNLTRRGRLQPDGNLVVYYWDQDQGGSGQQIMVRDYTAISDPCRFPSTCGSFGICSSSSSGGSKFTCSCPRNLQNEQQNVSDSGCPGLTGGSGSGACSIEDEFVEVRGADYFANDYRSLLSPAEGSVTGIEDCRSRCLGRCSCRAFFFRNDTGACFHTEFQRSLLATSNLQDTAFIRVPSPAAVAAAAARSRRRRRLAVGISLLVVVAVCAMSAVVIGVYYLKLRMNRKEESVGGFSDEDSFGSASVQEVSVLRDRHSHASC